MSLQSNKAPTKNLAGKSFFKQFCVFFIPSCVVTVLAFSLLNYLLNRHDQTLILARQQTQNDLTRKLIEREFQLITSDIHFLSHSPLLRDFVDSPHKTARQMLEAEFKNFSTSRGLYDQIRFLNTSGMEVIRINYNNGLVRVVPPQELQDKSKRYYFTDSINLPPGEIFISPFDLNIEKGTVERPLKPMIRFCTPVFDKENHLKGVVILNYLGDFLLSKIKETTSFTESNTTSVQSGYKHSILLNKESYFLLSRQKNEEWGFMFNQKITFNDQFPNEWHTLKEKNSGQFITDNGVFTFTTITPLEKGQQSSSGSAHAFKTSIANVSPHGYYWKLLSHVDQKQLQDIRQHHHKILALFFPLIIISAIVACWVLVRTRIQKTQAILLNAQNVEKFQTMADFSYDWEEWLATDGSYAYISPSCENLTGYSAKEFYSNPELFHKIIHPDDLEMVKLHHSHHLIADSKISEMEFRIITKNGQVRWIWHYCRPVFRKDGTWTGRRIANRDITEKYKAESVLQQERDMFLKGPVVTFYWQNSDNWPVEHVSGNVFDALGYSPQEFLDGSIKYATLIHPDDLDRVTNEVSHYSNNNASSFIHEPYRLKRHNGNILWVIDTTTIIRDEQGNITHYLGYLVDINEQKRQEAIVLESAVQKEQLNHLKSLKTMAGAIAHRFNNAMTVVQGNLDLMVLTLTNGSDEYKMAYDAAQASKGATHVGSMMLSYVGQRMLQRQTISFSDLIMKSVTTMRTSFQHPVSLKFSPPDTPLYCSVDEEQIQEVVESILSNAVESLEGETGTIEISFGTAHFVTDSFPIPFQNENTKDGIYAFCRIKDSGHGISPENFLRVFEPFYTTRFVGRGLGLALTVGIMQAHHGGVTIESSPEQGACVQVLLPVLSL